MKASFTCLGIALMHAGYRNVTFSPYTLADHTFLGGGVELNPGLLTSGAVYGRFNRAMSSSIADPNIIPSFKSTGYAFKVGYGKSNNYVDLLVCAKRIDPNFQTTGAYYLDKFTAIVTLDSFWVTAFN